MGRHWIVIVYVLVMVAAIVSVDVLFFRQHGWLRLMVNIGLALTFGAFYLRYAKPT